MKLSAAALSYVAIVGHVDSKFVLSEIRLLHTAFSSGTEDPDPAQQIFNNLTLEIGTERPLLIHDKILSTPILGLRSCLLL
jgi:hypothetical protein